MTHKRQGENMRVGNTYKDRGHYGRKAVWLSLGVLLFVPHAVCLGASKLDDVIIHVGERLYKWSHPCLFHRNPPRR
jgi:hypothetical protein